MTDGIKFASDRIAIHGGGFPVFGLHEDAPSRIVVENLRPDQQSEFLGRCYERD